jgi:RNA polymerase sigma-70 factor (ECF subfamily)
LPENPSSHIARETWERVAEGDETAFALLFQTLVPQLQAALGKWLPSSEGVKEVIQETFIRVWLNRDQLPGLEKPVNWIFRVASNESFTWLKKQTTRDRHYRQLAEQQSAYALHPEQDLGLQETAQLVRKALAQLPTQKRLIYELSREQGLKTAEIAEKLGLSHSHVRNALSSSLKFIREYLVAAGKVMALMAVFLRT